MKLIFKFNLVVAKTTTLPKLYLNFETNDNINLTVKSIFINQKSNGADILLHKSNKMHFDYLLFTEENLTTWLVCSVKRRPAGPGSFNRKNLLEQFYVIMYTFTYFEGEEAIP